MEDDRRGSSIKLPLLDIKKPRVGVDGEILVKHHPNANNDIVSIIESEGGEAVCAGSGGLLPVRYVQQGIQLSVICPDRIMAMMMNKAAIAVIETLPQA